MRPKRMLKTEMSSAELATVWILVFEMIERLLAQVVQRDRPKQSILIFIRLQLYSYKAKVMIIWKYHAS